MSRSWSPGLRHSQGPSVLLPPLPQLRPSMLLPLLPPCMLMPLLPLLLPSMLRRRLLPLLRPSSPTRRQRLSGSAPCPQVWSRPPPPSSRSPRERSSACRSPRQPATPPHATLLRRHHGDPLQPLGRLLPPPLPACSCPCTHPCAHACLLCSARGCVWRTEPHRWAWCRWGGGSWEDLGGQWSVGGRVLGGSRSSRRSVGGSWEVLGVLGGQWSLGGRVLGGSRRSIVIGGC